MRYYKVILNHDNGLTSLITSGRNKESVKESIMKSENCPGSAIELIKSISQSEWYHGLIQEEVKKGNIKS
jgi:hypothetical protein